MHTETPSTSFSESPTGFLAIAGVPTTLRVGDPKFTQPEVSIMIPTFRRLEFLREAISSALSQRTRIPFEVVVVDNDAEPSEDGLVEKMIREFQDHRLLYYRNHANLGMTGNWNRCVELARGNWFTLLHDDDWLLPTFLDRMFSALPSDADHLACASRTGDHGYDPELALGSPFGPRGIRRVDCARLSYSNVTPAPGVMCRRSLAIALGGFLEGWYPCSDYEFNIRAARRAKAYFLPERLAYYRIADSQTFKADTLFRIMAQSERLRRELLVADSRLSVRIASLAASTWWCRFGANRGLDVGLVFGDRPGLMRLASSRLGTWAIRGVAYILVNIF